MFCGRFKSIIARDKMIIKYFFCILLLLILIIIPLVVKNQYIIHLLITVGVNAILAMTFVMMLRTGLINLAIAGFWGIGAYTSTLLVLRLGISFWIALPASALSAGIFGLIVGFVFVRNSGFSFIVLTAVLGMVLVQVFGSFSIFGGHVGIQNIPPPEPISIPYLFQIEFLSKTVFYYFLLLLTILIIVLYSSFYSAWTGRAWKAIGLSPVLAQALGIDIFRYKLLTFVIASSTAGLMGSFHAHYFGSISPNTFGLFKTIYIHIYAIIGGIVFNFVGPIIGSLILTLVPEILRISNEIEPILTGFALVIIILFAPTGVIRLIKFRERG